ncbi:hypothetical protein Lser_V15G23584 [Lactuca serriola]|uniref:Uncharacterized protein n=1 Tax=Lactuca sativa TaxID=4236 RepID=A0A9R1X9X1_LACSA|nr:hypothetical protein LSAT_V11C500258410 [Lactuca sativa]
MDGEGKLTREKTRKTISLQTNESDIHSIDSEHKEADLKELTEGSPAKPEEDLIRVARGDSWRHKSSWTQLISSSSQSSFSISEIVPDLSFETHEPQAGAPIKDPTRTGVVAKATGRKEISSQRKRSLIIGNLESEETCPFMRTEASMKEWKKAKASLSSSLNKKKRSLTNSHY